MTTNAAVPRVPVTGCSGRFPMVDRNGQQIHVGDTIRAQVCTGRYGQTAIVETVVLNEHEPYGQIYAKTRTISFEFKNGILKGHHLHNDFEHGHETWCEIVK